MEGMEDDAANFLKKIVKTLIAGILWLVINMTAGIYLGWMFFMYLPSIGNYIFYSFVLLSLGGLLWFLYKLWGKPNSR